MKIRAFTKAKQYFGGGELTEVAVLYGTDRAVVLGCRKILSYATNEICIARRKTNVSVIGSDLYCVSFAAGSATIAGKIMQLQVQTRNAKEGAE